MTLRDVYADAWVRRHGLAEGWIVNMEPTYNLVLGSVGVVSGIDFQFETTLERRGVTGLQPDTHQHRSDTPWQFQSNDHIQVDLQSTGKTSGAVGAGRSASSSATRPG